MQRRQTHHQAKLPSGIVNHMKETAGTTTLGAAAPRGAKEKLQHVVPLQLAKLYVSIGRGLVILHFALRHLAQGCPDVCECACEGACTVVCACLRMLGSR